MDPRPVIQSQYLATLAMLEQAVKGCPAALWDAPEPANRFWQVAYHTLFYTHLYLQESESAFRPWAKHRDDVAELGAQDAANGQDALPPYTVDEVLEYLAFCREEVARQIPGLDLAQASGFYWLPFDKLELQIYNIRHIQHHTGELAERLGTRAGIDVEWVGRGQNPA
jgi:hypothetical protein